MIGSAKQEMNTATCVDVLNKTLNSVRATAGELNVMFQALNQLADKATKYDESLKKIASEVKPPRVLPQKE